MRVVGIFLAFNQAFVSRLFIRKFGEFNTLFIGIICAFIGLFAITLTNNLYIFIGFYYILNLGLSLSFPTFNAIISKNADPDKQGETMGISESINSFSMAIFPVFSALMYGFMGKHLYWFIAIIPAIAIYLAWRAKQEECE